MLTHILVHETRLKAGLEDPPAGLLDENGSSRQTPASGLRGSYRVLSYAAKRGQPDYKGLDAPSKKKRTKGGKGKKALKVTKTSNNNSLANYGESTAAKGNDQSSGPTAIPDQSSRTQEPAFGDAAALAHGEVDQMTVGSALLGVESERASSLEMSPSASEARPPRDCLPKSRILGQAAVDMSAELASGIGCCTLPHLPTTDAPNLFGSALAMKTMEKILLDCVKLNHALGRYGHETKMVTVTTKIERIRSFAEQIIGLGYDAAVYAVRKEHAIFAGKDVQARYNETIYWEIIKKGAKRLDPTKLSTAKGRLDDFTVAEKVATKSFMVEAGYGTSYANQRRCRRLWKSLSDMRKAGVDKILFYRTKEFDSFCAQFPEDAESSLVETVLSWEKVYGPHIEQLEGRVTKESKGDLTGRSWLDQPYVAERLDVPETSWNNAKNLWFSAAEEVDFKSTPGSSEVSGDQLGGLFDIHTAESGDRNKSIFVSLFPRGERCLSACPIITVQRGDFLGVFAGKIRYSESFDATYGIRGPKDNLWLDYSQVTGVLNLMRVSPPDGDANVHLQWELLDELDGKDSHLAWRVSVRALRTIKPFEEIVRAAPEKMQFLLHRGSASARRGFMKHHDADRHG